MPVWLRFDSEAETLAISEERNPVTAIVSATGSWPPAGATINLFTLRSVVETSESKTIELIAVEDAIRIATRRGHVLMHLLAFGPSSDRKKMDAIPAKKSSTARKTTVPNHSQGSLAFDKGDKGITPDKLARLFQDAAENTFPNVKHDLGYRHMIALAETFESWVYDQRLSAIQTTNLLGWAERLRQLAEEVGPDWDPPTPKRVSLIAYLGRMVLGEEIDRSGR